MKQIYLYISFLFLLYPNVWSQNETHFGDLYDKTLLQNRKPLNREPVRESDVVWQTTIWRTIDFREKFNQFFYFPYEKEGVEGRKNFVYTIWDAVINNEISVFEDDEFKIPIDNEIIKKRYTIIDTLWIEISDDEDNYEYKAVIVPKEFSSENIYRLKVKEIWYVDKELTAQSVQIIGMAFEKDDIRVDSEGDLELRGSVTLFWIPLMSENVKKLLANTYSYREYSVSNLPSWEHIFYERYFNSYIIRESNQYNRNIQDYYTGEKALKEAERIENQIFEMELDLWDY